MRGSEKREGASGERAVVVPRRHLEKTIRAVFLIPPTIRLLPPRFLARFLSMARLTIHGRWVLARAAAMLVNIG